MTAADLCCSTIEALSGLYRRREVSPVEVTRAVLERLHRLEPVLNAFITVLDTAALDAARRAEADFLAGLPVGPLHGVPLSLKDLFDTAGVRTTCASRILRDRVPGRDATVVARLRQAGAVLFGKANMLEFAYGIVHPDYGQCNNPWDPGRTSGGSSSGSGASVAAGVGFGSLGTDTGGSIRIPAAYCGIVGLKPTYGRVSRTGVFPLSWSLDHVGPMTRTVRDAALLLSAVAGPDPADPTAAAAPVPDYAGACTGEVAGLRLGVVRWLADGPDLQPAVREAFGRAVRVLEDAGMAVEEVAIPDLAEADPALIAVVFPEATAVHERWLRERPEDYAPGTRDQLEMGAAMPATVYLRARLYQTKLRAAFDAAFERVDAVAMPTVAFPAPAEDPVFGDAEAGPAEARRTGPFNLTGHPAISVPCGFTPEGLPVGLQLAGPAWSEATLFRIADAYERRAGWTARRPPVG